jgi:hypothetical protein
MNYGKAEVVSAVCDALLGDREERAKELARTEYPFEPIPARKRVLSNRLTDVRYVQGTAKRKSLSMHDSLVIWRRDGFSCRYTGMRLILPPALELLSCVLPDHFPYDNPPHGAYARTHIAMWELWPAIDHIAPIARSSDTVAANSLDNLVTASARVNAIKSSSLLDELGWTLRPPEPNSDWDGLTNWYVRYLERHARWLGHPTSGRRLAKWHKLLREH